MTIDIDTRGYTLQSLPYWLSPTTKRQVHLDIYRMYEHFGEVLSTDYYDFGVARGFTSEQLNVIHDEFNKHELIEQEALFRIDKTKPTLLKTYPEKDEIIRELEELDIKRSRLSEAFSSLHSLNEQLQWELEERLEERREHRTRIISSLRADISRRRERIETIESSIAFYERRLPALRGVEWYITRRMLTSLRRSLGQYRRWQRTKIAQLAANTRWLIYEESFVVRQLEIKHLIEQWKTEILLTRRDILREEASLEVKMERVEWIELLPYTIVEKVELLKLILTFSIETGKGHEPFYAEVTCDTVLPELVQPRSIEESRYLKRIVNCGLKVFWIHFDGYKVVLKGMDRLQRAMKRWMEFTTIFYEEEMDEFLTGIEELIKARDPQEYVTTEAIITIGVEYEVVTTPYPEYPRVHILIEKVRTGRWTIDKEMIISDTTNIWLDEWLGIMISTP